MSRARCPLALNPDPARQASDPAPSMFAPGTGRSTPGIVRVRLTKFRPFSGSASICARTTVVPSSELLVCTSGASAWISIASLIWPISSFRSARSFWSTPRCRLARLTFLNPLISAVTLYVPVGSSGAVNSPDGSVTTVRLRPVSVFTSVTVAPGIAAPDVSRTVPRIVPLTAWAASGRGASQGRTARETTAHRSTPAARALLICFIISSELTTGLGPVTVSPGYSTGCGPSSATRGVFFAAARDPRPAFEAQYLSRH